MIELIEKSDLIILQRVFQNAGTFGMFIGKDAMFCGTPRAKDYYVWAEGLVTAKTKETPKVLVCSNLCPYRIDHTKEIRTLGQKIKSAYFDNSRSLIGENLWASFLHSPKILIRGNDTRITAAIDYTPSVFIGVYGIKLTDHNKKYGKFIVAYLNSTLCQWVFFKKNPSVRIGGGYFSINSPQLLPLPFKEPTKAILDKVDCLVDEMMLENNTSTAVAKIEKKIDLAIYALYGLTQEEITIVEGTAQNAVSADTSWDAQTRELQQTKEKHKNIPSQSIEASADEQDAERNPKSKGPRASTAQNDDKPVRIDETEQIDVLCAIRQMFNEGLELTREEAFRKIAKELGYDRVGSKIEEILDSDIRTAVKRGILENERGTLKILCKTIDGYDRDFLKDQFLASIGRPWVEREEAVRAFTRFMGFRRVGEKIQDTVRSLINGLLREDRLESDGDKIRRKS